MRFLIVGCQRSGTTALAASLGRHPDITVWDESVSYRLLTEKSLTCDSVTGFKIPRWTDLLPGPTFGDPDQQLDMPFVWQDEPLLHILRDPLDVVASMDRLRMSGNVSWLDRYGVPFTLHRLRQSEQERQRWQWVLDMDHPLRRYGLGAIYWRLKCEAGLASVKAGWPVKLVIYERMTAEPERSLRQVLGFLGLPWDPRVLRPVAALKDPAGGTDPARPIDTASVGRGKTLPDDVSKLIESISGGLYEHLEALADG